MYQTVPIEAAPAEPVRPSRPTGPAVYDSIADLIANRDNPTPMVRVSPRFAHPDNVELFVKLERFNPFGSIKDRTALYLLENLAISAEQTLAEPTAGNTGIALAALANLRSTPVALAVPERTPPEKTALLRLLGVELLEVEDELCPLFPTEGARGVVKSLVESEAFAGRYVSPNQYENEHNVRAHYETTGPEIWDQMGGEVDWFFAAFGTCGTITGVGRYLKERNPNVRIIGVEPARRDHNLSGIKRVSDLPEAHQPKILDRELIDDIVAVEDEDAFRAGIELARTDGILVGPTTGALLHAARQLGADPGRAVVIAPDDATKYLAAYAPYL
jgi:cysteine synthase A/cysteine synthase B